MNVSLGFDLGAANSNKIGYKLGEAYGWIEGAANSKNLGDELGEDHVGLKA